jgi:sporulation protein YlmC with PRC-barrel domain
MKTTIVSQGDGLYMAVATGTCLSHKVVAGRNSATAECESSEFLQSAKKLIDSEVISENHEVFGVVTDIVLGTAWQNVLGFLLAPQAGQAASSNHAIMSMERLRYVDPQGNLHCGTAVGKNGETLQSAEMENSAALAVTGNGHGAGVGSAVNTGHRFSEITGMEVVNNRGEGLGRLLDVMIDVQKGRPSFAILSYGGCGRILAGLAAVPWIALNLDADTFVARLDAEAEELCQASIEDYEELQRAQVRRRIFRQFGQKDPAYWDNRQGQAESTEPTHALQA